MAWVATMTWWTKAGQWFGYALYFMSRMLFIPNSIVLRACLPYYRRALQIFPLDVIGDQLSRRFGEDLLFSIWSARHVEIREVMLVLAWGDAYLRPSERWHFDPRNDPRGRKRMCGAARTERVGP
jgi:hypothetical protein